MHAQGQRCCTYGAGTRCLCVYGQPGAAQGAWLGSWATVRGAGAPGSGAEVGVRVVVTPQMVRAGGRGGPMHGVPVVQEKSGSGVASGARSGQMMLRWRWKMSRRVSWGCGLGRWGRGSPVVGSRLGSTAVGVGSSTIASGGGWSVELDAGCWATALRERASGPWCRCGGRGQGRGPGFAASPIMVPRCGSWWGWLRGRGADGGLAQPGRPASAVVRLLGGVRAAFCGGLRAVAVSLLAVRGAGVLDVPDVRVVWRGLGSRRWYGTEVVEVFGHVASRLGPAWSDQALEPK